MPFTLFVTKRHPKVRGKEQNKIKIKTQFVVFPNEQQKMFYPRAGKIKFKERFVLTKKL